MMFDFRINTKSIISKDTQPDSPMFSKENPHYDFSILTPIIDFQFNEDEEGYSSNVYSLNVKMPTNFIIVHTDKGGFWKILVTLLGFGFNFSRQSEY